jgi:hypothetical protein
MASANAEGDGGEEEEDVDALEDGSESGGEEYESDDESEEAQSTILKGTLSEYKDDAGNNLLYSGTWSFDPDDANPNKFKLTTPLGDKAFNFTQPEPSYVFTGYFIMKDEEGNKLKVPETGVRVAFEEQENHKGKRWNAQGGGSNQFGNFTVKGEYRCKGDPTANKLNVEKAYEKKARKDKAEASDSEDDDFDGEPADEEELNGLEDDANLSVEELKAKYAGYANGASDAKGGGDESEKKDEEPAAKKRKTEGDAEEDF